MMAAAHGLDFTMLAGELVDAVKHLALQESVVVAFPADELDRKLANNHIAARSISASVAFTVSRTL